MDVTGNNKGYQIREIDSCKGIGIFATKNFQEGEVIFEEKPIFSAQFAWNKEYKYTACDHCMRPLETTEENIWRLTNDKNIVLPYPELCPTNVAEHTICDDCGVKYCSRKCRESAWKDYHKTVCKLTEPLTALNNAWMRIHFPPETTSMELIVRIIATIEQSANKEEALGELMKFTHSVIDEKNDLVLKLLGKRTLENLKEVQHLLSSAIPTTITSSLVSVEGLKTLLGLLGRNGQGIGSSVWSKWIELASAQDLSSLDRDCLEQFISKVYDAMDKEVGMFLNCEGSGLYKLQRCLNHNCVPNASVNFPYSDYTLSLVALTNIASGEEITVSYLDDCELARSRHSRQKHLRDYYLFECSCSKCLDQAQDSDVTSEDENSSDMETNQ